MASKRYSTDDLMRQTDQFGAERAAEQQALLREFCVAVQRELMDIETALRVVSDAEAADLRDRRDDLRYDLEEAHEELRGLD